MSKLLKSLTGSAFFAVLSFGAIAVAAPPPCTQQCKCTASCSYLCDDGGEKTTCGAYGICNSLCLSAPQVSMNDEKAQDKSDKKAQEAAESAAPVCSETASESVES